MADFCEAMESIAPAALAQSWDNVGLLAGDPGARARRVLLCIDLTSAVIDEAVREKADLVLAYHPPLFKPIKALRADSRGTDALLYRCIREGIAVYSTHTALDAADGGTNDVIASLMGIALTEPIEYVDRPGAEEFKLVVFVPPDELNRVSEAMFDAGAGRIGEYSHCSYRALGHGTFFGGESTKPAIGRKGRMETVDEIRLETIVPATALSSVIGAMKQAHSYEEPAFDIYPLAQVKPACRSEPVRGIGRWGTLPQPSPLSKVGDTLKRLTGATCVQIVGRPDREVERAVIVVGAAGALPLRLALGARDVIVTGEIRHHDALAIQRAGCSAVALGHWASERPALPALSRRLTDTLKGIAVLISEADTDPFRPL